MREKSDVHVFDRESQNFRIRWRIKREMSRVLEREKEKKVEAAIQNLSGVLE